MKKLLALVLLVSLVCGVPAATLTESYWGSVNVSVADSTICYGRSLSVTANWSSTANITRIVWYIDSMFEREVAIPGITSNGESLSASVFSVGNHTVTLKIYLDTELIAQGSAPFTVVDHSFTNFFYNFDASCYMDGTETANCDYGCDASFTQFAPGSALTHMFTSYMPNFDATCLTDGSETAFCDYFCGTIDTRTALGSALTHMFTFYMSNLDATCLTDGSETAYCDYGCGTSDTRMEAGSALGHLFTNYVSNSDAACLTDGSETALCDHSCGTDDTRTAVGSALGHLFTSYVSNSDAACLADGSETAHCDHGCGTDDTRTSAGSALGHAYTAVVTAPTCTSGGFSAFTCSRCGDACIGDVTSALGHTVVINPAVTAACTAPSLTEGKHCSACKEVLTAQKIIPARGHDYAALVTPRTCAEGGFTAFTCKACGDTYKGDSTSRLGHLYGAWANNGGGTHSAACLRGGCGYTVTNDCLYNKLTLGGIPLHVCPVCGDAAGTAFEAVTGAAAAIADGYTLPRGELAVFKARAPFGTEPLSIPGLPEGIGRVLYAFTAGYEFAGQMESFNGKVSVSLPWEGLTAFTLGRLDDNGSWVEIPYAFENGTLRFETDRAGLFLIVAKE